MSLLTRTRRETLISTTEAAHILNLSESAVRTGKAGTHGLTRVRQGDGKRVRVSLIREEVEAHVQGLIERARRGKR